MRIKKVRGVSMPFNLDLGRLVHNMYYGAYELEIVQLLKTYLRRGGTFLDIGANVGYFSGLALGLVGREGQVHSFEPVSKYYFYLEEIHRLNPHHRIYPNNIALGAVAEKRNIHLHVTNIGGSTLLNDYFPHEERAGEDVVTVRPLGDYLEELGIQDISLIKIDTQGFEFPILQGAEKYFQAHPQLRPPIICELTPSALTELGYSLNDFREYMSELGYEAWCICNTHKLDWNAITRSNIDVLFRGRDAAN